MREGMKIGFIGGGMMAGAIIAGLTSGRVLPDGQIFVSDHKEARCQELQQLYGVHSSVGAAGFLPEVDVLVLAVKPQAAQQALAEIREQLPESTLLVSIVAGMTLAALSEPFRAIGKAQPIVRCMPNTPLAVGEGMTAYALGEKATAEHGRIVQEIFAASGRAAEVAESQLDAVTGLSGSGPAYAFLLIDALADGGVAAGLKRLDAIQLAAQTLLGAARMVLETGQHPDVLRDQVTSPAGTTIAGVRVLERQGFRSAAIEAVLAAAKRSEELGKR